MKFDLLESSPSFKVPVFFVFGDNDWQTPFILTKEYLEKIEAPYKAFDLIKNSGHSTALDNQEEFAKYLTEKAFNIIFNNTPR
jgi:pimeloyl-ACP methyl ester carboxylesterase